MAKSAEEQIEYLSKTIKEKEKENEALKKEVERLNYEVLEYNAGMYFPDFKRENQWYYDQGFQPPYEEIQLPYENDPIWLFQSGTQTANGMQEPNKEDVIVCWEAKE